MKASTAAHRRVRVGYFLIPVLPLLLILSACPPPVDTAIATAVTDKLPPTITVTSPKTGASYTANVTVTGTVVDDALTAGDGKGTVRTIDYSVANDVLRKGKITIGTDGTASQVTSYGSGTISWTKASNTFSFTISTVTPTSLRGLLTIIIDSTDANGNASSSTLQLSESSGPVISLTSPTGTNLKYTAGTTVMTVSGTVANASDDLTHDDNISSIAWGVTGKSWGATINVVSGTTSYTKVNTGLVPATNFTFDTTTRTFSTAFTMPFINDTTLILTVTATDNNGHSTTSTNYLVADVSGPTLTLTSATSGLYYSPSHYTAPVITGNVDMTTGFSTMTVQVTTPTYTSDVVTVYPTNGTGDTGSYSFDTNPASGTYGNFSFLMHGGSTNPIDLSSKTGTATVTINAVNSKATTTAQYTIIMDNAAPTVTVSSITTSNSTGSYTKVGDTVTLNFTATDALSGLNGTPTVTIAGHLVTPIYISASSSYQAQYAMQASDTAYNNLAVPYTISATDNVGNVSTPTTGSSTFIFYDGLPTLSSVTIASNNPNPIWVKNGIGTTNGNVVTLSFTSPRDLSAVPTVTIATHSVSVSPSTTNAHNYTASYTYTATDTTDTEGTVPFTIDFTDAAGTAGIQVTAISSGSNVTYDRTPPLTPSIPLSSTGAAYINAAQRSASFTMTVSGLSAAQANAGDTLALLLGGTSLLTRTLTSADITADSYSFTILSTTGLGTDGAKSFTARVTDAAGNQGAASTALNLILDTTAPSAPSSAPTSSTGTAYINAVQDTAGIIITVGGLSTTGAVTGDTLTLLLGGSSIGTRTLTASDIASGYGFSVGSGLLGADGSKSFTAQVTDAAGNPGIASSALALTLDTVAPSAPSSAPTSSTGATYINAAQKSAGITITVGGLSTTGAVTGDTLTLLLGGSSIGTRTLTASDIASGYGFSVGSGLLGADGSKSFTAQITDAAGNPGIASSALALTLDTVAPSAPSSAPTSSTGATYINAAERTAGFTITVGGLSTTGAVTGDTLTLLLGGSSLLTHTLNASDISTGSYVFTVSSGTSLGADGSKSFTARVTDAAGNPGIASSGLVLTLDTTAPSAPSSAPTSSTGTAYINAVQDTAGITITVGGLSTTGAVTGDTLTLLLGGSSIGTRTLTASDIASGYGFSVGSGLLGADGSKSFTAQITDAAGNPGIASSTLALTLDTVAPSAPSSAPTSSTGATYINAAERTAGFTITVGGLSTTGAVTGDTLTLLLGGSSLLTHTLNASDISTGSYVFTVSSGTSLGADGSKSFTAQVTDAAGNPGIASSALALTLDTVAPSAPSSAPTSSTGATYINAAERTAGFTITVGGLSTTGAVTGDTLTLLLGGSSLLTHTLNASDISTGSYVFTVSSGTSLGADGSKSFTARVTDAAGNPGIASSGLVLTLDTTAPSAPSSAPTSSTGTAYINAVQDTAGITITVGGLSTTGAVTGDTLTLLLGGSSIGTRTLTASDIASGYGFSVGSGLLGADGSKSFTAQITDAAGNPGIASSTLALTLDTVAPSAPSSAPTSSTGATYINAAERTAGFTITVGGLSTTGAVTGDTLTLLLGGSSLLTHTLNASDISTGSYVFTVSSGTSLGADGSKSFTAQVTDAAGNPSGTGPALGLTLDATAPSAPTAPTGNTGTAYIDSAQDTAGITVTVSLSSTGAAAGDTLTLLMNSSSIATQVLSSTDITNGNHAFSVISTTLGSDGSKSFTAQITDAAGNPSSNSSALNLTLDTAPPTISSVSFANPTSTLKIGSSEVITLTLSATETTLTAGTMTVNGKDVSTTLSHTSGTSAATVTYVVASGDTDQALNGIPISFALTDAAGNTNGTAFTTTTATPAVDANAPTIASFTYDSDAQITVTFSEGVYRNSNATGALNNSSLTVTDTTHTGRTTSATVTHTAGASTATIGMSWNTVPSTGDTIVVALGGTIYDAAGNSTSSSSASVTRAISLLGLVGIRARTNVVDVVASRVIGAVQGLIGVPPAAQQSVTTVSQTTQVTPAESGSRPQFLSVLGPTTGGEASNGGVAAPRRVEIAAPTVATESARQSALAVPSSELDGARPQAIAALPSVTAKAASAGTGMSAVQQPPMAAMAPRSSDASSDLPPWWLIGLGVLAAAGLTAGLWFVLKSFRGKETR